MLIRNHRENWPKDLLLKHLGFLSHILNQAWLKITVFESVWVSKGELVIGTEVLWIEKIAKTVVVELAHDFP
jgi:hypothetical protein